MHNEMSKIRWVTGTLLLGSALTFAAIGISGNASVDWDKKEFGEHDEGEYHRDKKMGDIQDPVYTEECGACHLAYPPGLLPRESWRRIMGGLGDHFGDNAELEDAVAGYVSQYLEKHASPKGKSKKANRKFGELSDEPPLRITELPYFIHEHDEIPERLVKDNPKVKSFSQCDSCHTDAAKGWFDEDRVTIPGYGRWDD